jgi:predicted MFS family arabinose efflux permease
MTTDATAAGDAPDRDAAVAAQPRWLAFGLLCFAYLAATAGEQMLSPLFPTAADDLGLTVAQGGVAFGVLTGSIAVMNLVGGRALRSRPPLTLIRVSAVVGAGGAVVNAVASGYALLLAGQMLLGSAAGLFFPAGLQSVGLVAGPARRGFAIGLYGVAFSLGLTTAAALGALGAGVGWRVPFWIAGGIFAAVAASCSFIRIPDVAPATGEGPVTLRLVMSLPTAVGSVLAVCQYGSVTFLATFAVDRWGTNAASAATVLIIGRVLSIGAKIIGGASADRIGAKASARRTSLVLTATGLAWVLLPGGIVTYAIAAIFVGTASSLGPVANILAVERFGHNGMALGAYRSVQIGLGALASVAVGLVADAVGLRPTLAVAALGPLLLLWICREARPPHRPSGRTIRP